MLRTLVKYQRPIIVALGLFLLFWLFYFLRGIFIPFVMGFILAYILAPVVQMMENREIPRSIAIMISYAAFRLIAFYFLCSAAFTKGVKSVRESYPAIHSSNSGSVMANAGRL